MEKITSKCLESYRFYRMILTPKEARMLASAMGRASTTGKPERVLFDDGTWVEVIIPVTTAPAGASHSPIDGDLF